MFNYYSAVWINFSSCERHVQNAKKSYKSKNQNFVSCLFSVCDSKRSVNSQKQYSTYDQRRRFEQCPVSKYPLCTDEDEVSLNRNVQNIGVHIYQMSERLSATLRSVNLLVCSAKFDSNINRISFW